MSERRLKVLTWPGRWGEALRAAVSEPFERETRVQVSHVVHVGLALPDALSEALVSDTTPPVDVVWSNSAPALRVAAAKGCVALDPDVHPVLRELRKRARPERYDGFPCVHPYAVQYVLCYRRSVYPYEPPRSWEVLTDPLHRGRIAMYPAGNGFFPIAQVMGGGDVDAIPDDMDHCWSWLRQLRGQIGSSDYSVGMERRLLRGELDLCFRALPNVLAFQDAGADVDWSVPDEGTTDTLDAMWIPVGVPGETVGLAAQYIAFALSADVQRDWCGRLGVLPMHREASRPEMFDRRASRMPANADDRSGVLFVPEAVKAVYEPHWGRVWDLLVGRSV